MPGQAAGGAVMRRMIVLCLETVAGVAALLGVVAGVGIWQLSRGPVTLDSLTPRLERALNAANPDTTVRVGGTALAWRGWPDTLALRLRNVRVRRDGEPFAQLPELDMQLAVSALLRGTVAPRRVTARGARLTLVRRADGFDLGGDGAPEEAGGLLARLLDELMAEPSPDNRLSYLNAVRAEQTAVRVRDKQLGLAWRAPEARVALRRTKTGLSGTADATVSVSDARVRLDGELAYTAGAGEIAVRGRAANLEPAAVAKAIPELSLPGTLTTPLDATIRTRLGLDGRVGDIAARLEAGAGAFTWPDRYDTPLPIRDLSVEARYARGEDRLAVRDLALTLGTPDRRGPRVTGEATVANLRTGAMRVDGEVQAKAVAMQRLDRYWPKGAATKTREWITRNIPSGRVNTAEFTTQLRLPDRLAGPAEIGALDGRMRFRDAAVHYLRPLPPVTGVSGRATVDTDAMSITTNRGSLGPVSVPAGEIAITGLDAEDQDIAIDLNVDGPLRHALTVLDHPRLGFAEELGLSPGATSGRARGELHFAFPLLDDLRAEQVTARAEGTLTGVRVRDFLLGQNATEGNLDLAVSTERMRLSGPVSLGGIPLSFAWTERFDADDGVVSEMRAQVEKLTDADRRDLGVDTAPHLRGPVSGTLVSRQRASGERVLDAAITLDRAELAAERLGWRKPVGRPGSAAATVRLRPDAPPELEAFSITAGGDAVPRLETTGTASVTRDGALRRATLDRLRLGETDLETVTVQNGAQGRWSVRVGGGTLDARPWLDDGAALTYAATEGEPPPPITVAVAPLARVSLGDGRHLQRVALNARRDDAGTWQALRVSAQVPDSLARGERAGGRVSLRYRPGADGRQGLRAEAANLGATLRALDVTEDLRGGTLRVDGTARSAAPSSAIDGEVNVDDLMVKDVPALARLLTLASLQGPADMLSGSGITFREISGGFTYADGRVATQLIHAYGPSLGLTTKGTLEVPGWRADLEGTVVPAARVNRLLEKIPLLGKLITGGEGQGVIAMRYTLTGPLGDPEIRVNPLSALTPGFLRGVFGLFDRDPAPDADWPKAVPDSQASGK